MTEDRTQQSIPQKPLLHARPRTRQKVAGEQEEGGRGQPG